MSDNELIAEFMGIHVRMFGSVLYISDEDGFIDFKNEAAPYWPNKSWNQLMPAVEKIAKIETDDIIRNGEDSYFDSYFTRTFGMINSETKEFMVRINRSPLHQSASLINATYAAVVEFIKWHNKQQPPQKSKPSTPYESPNELDPSSGPT